MQRILLYGDSIFLTGRLRAPRGRPADKSLCSEQRLVNETSRLKPASLRSTGIYARVDSATVPRLFEKIRRAVP